MHSRRDTIIGWALVALQFGFIAAVVLLPRDAAFDGGVAVDVFAWALVAVAGVLGLWGFRHLGSGLTPLPLPNGAVGLVTSGPYRWMRHPIYTAVMIGMIGVAVRTRSILPMTAAVGLVVFLNLKARWEETHLVAGFDGYAGYAARTARFLPLRRPEGDGRPGSGGHSGG